MDIRPGVVVRAQGWPDTKGARFLVTGIDDQPNGGTSAHLLEFDGGTPFRYRCIPVQHLSIDQKATRERAARALL